MAARFSFSALCTRLIAVLALSVSTLVSFTSAAAQSTTPAGPLARYVWRVETRYRWIPERGRPEFTPFRERAVSLRSSSSDR